MPDFSIWRGLLPFLNSAGLPISRGGYSVFEGSTLITPCMYPLNLYSFTHTGDC